jgi:SHS2 domain-containing protein
LRIRSADLNTLFAEAGQALFAVLVEDLATVAPVRKLDFAIAGDDREYLLFDWLKELLYRFDAEHLLLSRFEVKIDADGLRGSAWGEPLDPARHELSHEVKAITYHGLRVEPDGDGWLAEVIVDI